jgi:hypothetical protein
MKRRTAECVLAAYLAVLAPCAEAGGISLVGSLDAENPNDAFITSFTLLAPSAVTIQTWSFGGGVNAAGTSIAPGGFDPYVSLFNGAGPAASFLASNDDGLCPPGHASEVCADSTLTTALLSPGTYTLALTLPFNFSFAENLGVGTLGDGFIGLDSSFNDGSCAATCSSAYAIDIQSTTPVPEPATCTLLAMASALLLLVRRHSCSVAKIANF